MNLTEKEYLYQYNIMSTWSSKVNKPLPNHYTGKYLKQYCMHSWTAPDSLHREPLFKEKCLVWNGPSNPYLVGAKPLWESRFLPEHASQNSFPPLVFWGGFDTSVFQSIINQCLVASFLFWVREWWRFCQFTLPL